MKKKMFACLLAISMLCACANETDNITENGKVTVSPDNTSPSTGEISEENNSNKSTGTIDLDNKTFTEQFIGYSTKTEDCELKIVFDFTYHEDEANSTKMYLDSVEYSSIETISGWDGCEFLGIDSIEYSTNNQVAYIYWTYQVEKDGETWTDDYMSILSLYDIH